jgi:hypothetical protein
MDTTVTGMFENRQLAAIATASLARAGFPASQTRVVDLSTPDHCAFIADRTSDKKRAVMLGILFGAVGGSLAGFALGGEFFDVPMAVLGGLTVAAGGAMLGLCVGHATTSQVQTEMENQVDAGIVLVSVTTESPRGPDLLALLAKEGGTSVVATPTTFTASVLPSAAS